MEILQFLRAFLPPLSRLDVPLYALRLENDDSRLNLTRPTKNLRKKEKKYGKIKRRFGFRSLEESLATLAALARTTSRIEARRI